MKIICFIDTLNSGGAQRQMSYTASGLAELGHQVKVVTLHPIYFFKPLLDEAKVEVETITAKGMIGRIVTFRKMILNEKPDAVYCFMDAPNLVASIVRLLTFFRFKLVISERKGFYGALPLKHRLRLSAHILANYVTSNSEANANYIRNNVPFIRRKVKVVYNILDFQKYFYQTPKENNVSATKIIVVANYRKEKNIEPLIEVANQLKTANRIFEIHWYGNNFFQEGKPTTQSDVYLNALKAITDNHLEEVFFLHPHTNNLLPIYSSADLFCLTSLFEGFPNVVCEAMATGRTILASDVSDVKNIIEHQKTGYIFNPLHLDEMKAAIIWGLELSNKERIEKGKENSEKAKLFFQKDKVLNRIIDLLQN